MAKSNPGTGKKRQKQDLLPPEPVPPQHKAWLDLFANSLTRFSRYSADVLGLGLILIGLLTALGLAGWTRGVIIAPFSSIVQLWFGWGSYILVAAAVLGGIYALQSHAASAWKISFARLLSLEGAVLTGLPLLTLAGGSSLARAQTGLDGGLVGWGLADIFLGLGLDRVVVEILLGFLMLFFLSGGLGVADRITAWSDRVLEGEPEPEPAPASEPRPVLRPKPQAEPAAPVQALPAPEKVSKPRGAKPAGIPAEFKKSLKPQPAEAEPEQPPLIRDERLPPLNLLGSEQNSRPDERTINLTAGMIEKSLADFGIPAKVTGYRVGPTVTQYAVEPGYLEKPGPDGQLAQQKVRVAQISALSRDLALALSAERLRIEAPVPGRSYVGIEVPNNRSSVVRLRS
ncbi:MAG TPA: DNA translocase FtsK, partial [Anaerolineaceae bacterium]